ncbi:MAG: chromate transporter [Pseudomonadota bacterium]|nr:chromate transporter [Pseudomonadota bacterium]
MIYVLLAYEFFKIGLFAVGGGLVTVPFLYDLTEQYDWFTAKELTDMIAVSQSTPGPTGINMATYAGYKAAGIAGGVWATLWLVAPSVIVVYLIAKILNKWSDNPNVLRVLGGIRPAVLALILFAGWDIAKESITNVQTVVLLVVLVVLMRFYKKSAIFYIVLSAVAGLIFRI